MIPREILKKIRQIEIRTNRIVIELALFALGSLEEAREIGRGQVRASGRSPRLGDQKTHVPAGTLDIALTASHAPAGANPFTIRHQGRHFVCPWLISAVPSGHKQAAISACALSAFRTPPSALV